MTSEETKYYFQQLMNRMEGINLYKPEGGIALGAKEQLFGVIDMALGKQLPKKVTKFENLTYTRFCPTCEMPYDPFDYMPTFCGECGQRLDWSDEE